MIKVIIFDYDDTLVQTRKTRYKTIKKLSLDQFNYEMSDEEIDNAWGLPADEFLLKLFGAFSNHILDLWALYLEYSKQDLNSPHENAFEFIFQNHKHLKFGIVTSSSEKVVLRELNELEMDLNLFFNIQTSESTSVHKPNPKVYSPIYEVLEKEKIKKEEVLYIGDSPADYESSSKFGFHFIGMAHDERYTSFFENENIEYVRSFQELEWIIKEKIKVI